MSMQNTVSGRVIEGSESETSNTEVVGDGDSPRTEGRDRQCLVLA